MPLLPGEIEVGSERVGKEVWLCSALSIQNIPQIVSIHTYTCAKGDICMVLVGYSLFVDTILLAMNRVTMVDSGT